MLETILLVILIFGIVWLAFIVNTNTQRITTALETIRNIEPNVVDAVDAVIDPVDEKKNLFDVLRNIGICVLFFYAGVYMSSQEYISTYPDTYTILWYTFNPQIGFESLGIAMIAVSAALLGINIKWSTHVLTINNRCRAARIFAIIFFNIVMAGVLALDTYGKNSKVEQEVCPVTENEHL